MNRIVLHKVSIFILLLSTMAIVGCNDGSSDANEKIETVVLNFETNESNEINTDVAVDIVKSISPYNMSTPLTQDVTLSSSRAVTPVVQNSLAPILLEVDSIGDASFKGLIFGVSRDRFETSLKDAKLRIKAKMIRVDNIPVYIGTAVALSESNITVLTKVPLTQTTHEKLEGVAWTFIAIPPDKTLSGPQVGRVFQVYGQTDIQAVCIDDKIDGMFNLTNINKGINISGVFATPLPNSTLCDKTVISGVAKSSLDLKVISTHIGPVLSGEGFLSVPSKSVKGVDMYSLAIAKNLTISGDIVDTVLTSSTHALDPEAARELLGFTDKGEAVFESLKGNLANIKEGDFIVSKPRPRFPNGFLRKVDIINTINGKIVLTTSQGHIGDILKEANIELDRSFDIYDVEEGYEWFDKVFDPTAFEPIQMKNQIVKNRKVEGGLMNIPFNKVIYDKDGDHASKDDQIAVKGNLSFDVNAKVKLACSGFLCSKPDFLAKFTAGETAELEVIGSVKWSKSYIVDLPPKLLLPPITVFPLIFIPTFTAQLKVDGELSASIEYSAVQELEFVAGVEYTPDDGWGDLSGYDKSFTSFPPIYSGELDAKAELAIKASFMLYGIAGVYADLGGYVNFNAALPRDPAWELRGGITSSAGVDLNVIVWSEQFGIDLLDVNWQIKKAGNMPPIITLDQPSPRFSGPVYDKIVVLGGQVRIDFEVTDPEGETALYVDFSSSIDGDMGNGKAGVKYYTFENEGVHRISATVSDSKGATSTVSMDVEVVDVNINANPGVVTSNIPSSVRDDGFSSSLEIVIEPNSDTVIDKVEWWLYDGDEYKEIGSMIILTPDLFPELIWTTTSSGDSQTHSVSYKFEHSLLDTAANNKEIHTKIYFTKEGLPSQVEIHSYDIEIKNQIFRLGKITDLHYSSLGLPEVGKEVTFTPTISLGADSVCERVTWTSSNLDDGIDGYFPPSGVSGPKIFSFDTAGKRTITAAVSDNRCSDSSFSKEIKIEANIGGVGSFYSIN